MLNYSNEHINAKLSFGTSTLCILTLGVFIVSLLSYDYHSYQFYIYWSVAILRLYLENIT